MSRWLAILCALLASAPAAAQLDITAGNLELLFAENGDLLQARACLPACGEAGSREAKFGGVGPGTALVAFSSYATEAFSLAPGSEDGYTTLLFANEDGSSTRRWRVPDQGWRLELETRGAQRMDISAGAGMRPPEAYGFGEWLEAQRYVLISGGDVHQIGPEEAREPQPFEGWAGFRNRFWAVMLNTAPGVQAGFRDPGRETKPDPGLLLALDREQFVSMSLYLGPVERAALNSADHELGDMMYAGIWFWLRWICMGLAWLLAMIQSVVPNWALAIMVLSLAVNILMRPLSKIADSLQDDVHQTEGKLAPELREIQAKYKGEEQSKRILAMYKEHGVHPLYSLKSLAGVAVVIPVFIGAFDMLAENIWLAGESVLWIADLARTDAVAALPFTIPFFGAHLNLLPFIMTGLSVVASILHRHEAMDELQYRKHKRNLTLMALAFLALFYTFPAGMVLYWTTNNLISVIKYAWQRRQNAASGTATSEEASD